MVYYLNMIYKGLDPTLDPILEPILDHPSNSRQRSYAFKISTKALYGYTLNNHKQTILIACQGEDGWN
jgi:hypothetical protein